MAHRLQGEQPEAAGDEGSGEPFSVLDAVGRVLAEAANPEDAMPRLLQTVGEGMSWLAGAWWALEQPAGALRCASTWHAPSLTHSPFQPNGPDPIFHRSQGPVGQVLATAHPLWTPDLLLEPTALPGGPATPGELRSALLVPALDRGQVVGILGFYGHRATPPDERMFAVVQTVGREVGAFIRCAAAEAALRRSEAVRKALLEAPLDAVVMTDHQGTVVEFNPAAEALFGYRRDQALGRKVFDLLVPPSARDRNRAGLARHVATGEPSALGRRIEGEGLRADGATLPVEVTTVRLAVEGPPLFVGYVRDLTAHRRAQTAQTLLAEVGLALTEGLDMDTALERVARRAVPAFADWCAIDLLDGHGEARRVAAAHADPARAPLLRELAQGHSFQHNLHHPGFRALASGRPLLETEITEAWLQAIADTPSRLALLRELGPHSLLTVPLKAGGRSLGTLTFGLTNAGRRYTQDDLPLAEELGRRCALVVDNQQLQQAERSARQAAEQAAERTARLQTMTSALALARTREEIADAIAILGVHTLKAVSGAVGLRSADGATLEITTRMGNGPAPSWRSMSYPVTAARPAAVVVRTGTPIAIDDRESLESRFPDFVETAREINIQSTYLMPLVANGEVIGVLAFGFGAPRHFDEADRAFMLSIAQQCVVALDRVRLLEAERDARRDAARLQEVTAACSAAATMDEVIRTIMQRCRGVLEARAAMVGLLSNDGLLLDAMSGTLDPDGAPARRNVPLTDVPAPVADAARTGEPVWVKSVAALRARYPALAATWGDAMGQSLAVLPLRAGNHVVGVLALSFPTPHQFPERERAFLHVLTTQCGQALDRARLYEQEMAGRVREEAERSRLTALIETSPIGVVVLEAADEQISLMNQEARRVLGDPPERPQTLCQCEAAAQYRRPDGAPYDPKDYPWRRALHDGQTVRGEEVHFALGDGRVTPTLVSASPVRSADGTIFAAVVTIADFTARKEIETLQASVTALASHELRTPLHHIKGFANTLLQQDVHWDEETQRDLLQRIERETDRLTELVNDILEISRLESGRSSMERQLLALRQVVDAGLEASSQFLADRQVAVDVGDGLRVTGDSAQLERVIVNLLENAAKYTPAGTRVEVRARLRGAHVIVSVADQGPGIPPTERERIFEKYVRLQDARRKAPGTGLGLPICRVIVEGHGGRIWVEGEAGKGSVFCFTLPLASDP